MERKQVALSPRRLIGRGSPYCVRQKRLSYAFAAAGAASRTCRAGFPAIAGALEMGCPAPDISFTGN
jgi:hypothetical protein